MADSTNVDPPTGQPFAENAHHDPETDTYRATFDATADSVVVTVVETVASATDQDPIGMPPLYATVDPESLDALVTGSSKWPVEVTFRYVGCHVSVSSDGKCIVDPEPT